MVKCFRCGKEHKNLGIFCRKCYSASDKAGYISAYNNAVGALMSNAVIINPDEMSLILAIPKRSEVAQEEGVLTAPTLYVNGKPMNALLPFSVKIKEAGVYEIKLRC